jgi:hypothetical protein
MKSSTPNISVGRRHSKTCSWGFSGYLQVEPEIKFGVDG